MVQYLLKLNPYGYTEQMGGGPGGSENTLPYVSVMTFACPEVTSELQTRALFPKQDHVFIYDARGTLTYNVFIYI